MQVHVGDVRLFSDVDGEGLVAAGPARGDRPALIHLSGGPRFDHTVFKFNDRMRDDVCHLARAAAT